MRRFPVSVVVALGALVGANSGADAQSTKPVKQSYEMSAVEAAMAKLRAKDASRARMSATQPAQSAASAPIELSQSDREGYSAADVEKLRKAVLDDLHVRSEAAKASGLQSRRPPTAELAEIGKERALVMRPTVDAIRALLVERDTRNAEIVVQNQRAFGSKEQARELGLKLLRETSSLEQADFVGWQGDKAVYRFQFETKAGLVRRYTGAIHVERTGGGLYYPSVADLDGVTPVRMSRQFEFLRDWHVTWSGRAFELTR